jgi:hypothetical protein
MTNQAVVCPEHVYQLSAVDFRRDGAGRLRTACRAPNALR